MELPETFGANDKAGPSLAKIAEIHKRLSSISKGKSLPRIIIISDGGAGRAMFDRLHHEAKLLHITEPKQFPGFGGLIPYHGIPIVPMPMADDTERIQWRFPRSRKKRIRNKWAKDWTNFKFVEKARVVMMDEIGISGRINNSFMRDGIRHITDFGIHSASIIP